MLNRRQLLISLAATALPASGHSAQGLRVAAIDWAMLETSIALGVMPIAATELLQFRQDAVEPVVPNSVADLGLRGSPNFEYLVRLKPDLILSSPFYARQKAALERIAPVLSLPFYVKGEGPLAKAIDAVSILGARLGRQKEAQRVLADREETVRSMKALLAPFSKRATYLINIGDARHFRAFGSDSMFGDTMAALGLSNAWTDRSRYTFAAPVPLEALAARPDARIVVVSDVPVEARNSLHESRIWRSLEPVKRSRVHYLANINPYGGIEASLRFARLFTNALTAGEP
ncbi:iron-siderophore ABC transporter substrate-binding protein [Rhizobium cauense]|uniref:iron-siderophore ABC transporter substrate-binding protein n=1 Tax=Rhizobium cauense TaxID=1166683 RepID=UPI001C6F037B|nr:iron-siderophore ABC transporter substrate-binding protein [Rhizobium cauense]MBW9117951.1 iron-siderophore ABC transporter substrate-binding protein [Rhizobium cauense]